MLPSTFSIKSSMSLSSQTCLITIYIILYCKPQFSYPTRNSTPTFESALANWLDMDLRTTTQNHKLWISHGLQPTPLFLSDWTDYSGKGGPSQHKAVQRVSNAAHLLISRLEKCKIKVNTSKTEALLITDKRDGPTEVKIRVSYDGICSLGEIPWGSSRIETWSGDWSKNRKSDRKRTTRTVLQTTLCDRLERQT